MMRRNLRKAMSAVLVAAMTFGTPIAVNQNVTVAEAADSTVAKTKIYTPAYFYDFEGGEDKQLESTGTENGSDTKAKIIGDGSIETSSDGNSYFDNASTKNAEVRKNYLNLPSAIDETIKNSANKAVTISFKVNGSSDNYIEWSPAFIMQHATDGVRQQFPYLALELRGEGLTNIGSAGVDPWYIDAAGNNKIGGTIADGYLGDKKWHTLTMICDIDSVKVYIDGAIANEATKVGANAGLFKETLELISLGGNQANTWGDADAQIYYDDVAIFDYALNENEVKALSNDTYTFTTAYSVSCDTTGVTGGTVEDLTTTDYEAGSKVKIVTVPDEGTVPTVTIKDSKNNIIDYDIVEGEDGKQIIQFTMPKSDVTISNITFGKIADDVNDLIKEAEKILSGENKSETVSTKYTEKSFNTLKDTVDNAKEVIAKENATTKELKDAKNALSTALESLVFKHDVKIDTEKAVLIGGKDITVTAEDKSEESKAGTWTSSNEDAATVENGVINAVADGTSTVTYTAADGTKASCKVTVIGTALLAGQSVNYSSAIADKDVTWSSSNEDVATVNEKGVVTAVANGETTITVSNGDTFEVTVSNTVANGKKAWADKVYSNAIEVTENGAYLTFKSTTSSDQEENVNLKYFTPVYKVTNADSKWVVRGADGWFSGDGLGTGTSALIGGNSYSTLFTDTETSSDREKWTTDNMNGINCYLSAKKDGNNIIVKWTMGDRTIQSTIPVKADEKSYISLSGELCDLSDIKVLTKEEYSAVEPVPFTPGSVADAAKTPGPEIDVPIDASEVVADETQSGTEWWTGMTTGKDYVLSGTDVTTELYVAADKLVNGYGAFSVEVYTNDRKFFTTGSDKNAWTAEQATGILSPFTAGVSELVEGHVYKITVTRKDKDITVKYYDATAQKDYFEVSLTDSNFNDEFMVHILYQVGTFSVGQTVNVDPNKTPAPTASTPSETTAPTAEPDNTVAPTTEPSAEPSADVTTAPTTAPSTEPSKTPAANTVSKGDKATVSGAKYVATSSKEVSYTAAKKATTSVVIPATVKVNGKTLKVTSIAAKAFKGNSTVKTLTVGSVCSTNP